jgi:hypothetical protein
MFVALGLWAVARFLVAFTWRDAQVLGPLRADQLLSLIVLAVAIAGFLERSRAPLQSAVEPRLDMDARPA